MQCKTPVLPRPKRHTCCKPKKNNVDLLFDHTFHLSFLNKAEKWTCIVTWKYWEGQLRLELWPDTWILHHNIASAHDVHAFRVFLAKNLNI
jgi:hypothetical protein